MNGGGRGRGRRGRSRRSRRSVAPTLQEVMGVAGSKRGSKLGIEEVNGRSEGLGGMEGSRNVSESDGSRVGVVLEVSPSPGGLLQPLLLLQPSRSDLRRDLEYRVKTFDALFTLSVVRLVPLLPRCAVLGAGRCGWRGAAPACGGCTSGGRRRRAPCTSGWRDAATRGRRRTTPSTSTCTLLST